MLHVTFGPSAAGSLKQALELVGRTDRVIWDDDDLGYGPIEPHAVERRAAFETDALGHVLDENHYAISVAFWDEAVSTDATVVAWISRRCVREYAGWHALVARRTGPTQLVDVADVAFTDRDGAPSPATSLCFGFVRHDQIVEHRLFETARALTDLEEARLRATWARLGTENAALRILDDGALVSAPLAAFDARILACTSPDWQSSDRLVGTAWHRIGASAYQTSDTFVWARLRALEAAGVLEARGDRGSMHDSELRLAPA